MIISDAHRFAFVHVPKCAGSTVRDRLRHLDDTGGAFENRVEEHPELGTIDWVHIPLFVLRAHFPAEYAKVRDYRSFALVRDPFERFPSALFQRLRMYGSTRIEEMSEAGIRAELDDVVRVLAARDAPDSYLPAEYIHFQRQTDFIMDRGEPMVTHLHTTSRVATLLAEIGALAGEELGLPESRSNRTMVYRSETVRRVLAAAQPVAEAVLPDGLRTWLGDRILPRLHVPRDRRFAALFGSDRVRDFVRSYYAADIELFRTVAAGEDGSRE